MKQIRALAIVAFTCLLAACSKDKTTTPPTPTPTKPPKELIIGTWAIQSVTCNDPANPDPLQPCGKDDLLTFKTDGSCVYDQGATLCDPASAKTENGTWNVDGYPTLKLNLPTDTFNTTTKILQLDASALKLERVYTRVSPTIFIETYKKQ